ncbi:MATE family efflux transporter, partial [Streptococcus suis]
MTYKAGPILKSLNTKHIQAVQASQTVLYNAILGVPFTARTLIMTALTQGMGKATLPINVT